MPRAPQSFPQPSLPQRNSGLPVVSLEGIVHIYPGGRTALRGISLSLEPGERVGLVGPSGAGKSTLLRLLNGLVTPSTGSVEVLERDVVALADPGRRSLRREIGMIFQEFALIERLSVLTNVLVGRLGYLDGPASIFRLFPPADIDRAKTALNEVGLDGTEDRLVRNLSGGQKQRVGIARALVQEASLILADEPTANLDVKTSDDVLTLLVQLCEDRHSTLIMSLHDVHSARKYCSRVVALREGQIEWDGPAAEFSERLVEQVFYSVR